MCMRLAQCMKREAARDSPAQDLACDARVLSARHATELAAVAEATYTRRCLVIISS